MGRKVLYSKKEFVKAYKKAKSFKELASVLQVSIPTLFNYLKRYKLKPYKALVSSLPFTIAKAFVYDNTIRDLSKKFNLSPSVIRYHLEKFVLYPARFSLTSDWSSPNKVSHIKVINALMANPKAADNPRKILHLPGMTVKLVNDYWFYATGLTLKDYKK